MKKLINFGKKYWNLREIKTNNFEEWLEMLTKILTKICSI